MDKSEFRRVGHRVVDLLADYLEETEDHPLFPQVTPAELEELFDEPLPREGASAESVLKELEEKLLPHCVNVNHPGYMGLITPTPTPMGVLGDFICSALNQNIGAYTIGPAGIAIERRTVRWLTDLIGYDERAGGNLASGGTMASFLGLKLARDWVSQDQIQHRGVRDRWAVYVSEERHVAIDKAVDAVGVGRDALRALPTDDEFRIRIDALEDAIRADLREGIRSMCIIGIAGTTNTGSVDPLGELSRIAQREGAWFHVDAAYGGGMLLSHRNPECLAGLALADSVALDPHKWFYAPLDVGAILVKDDARLTASFGMQPAYLTDEMDTGGERYQYYVHGFEQSRRFRGLKVWMSLKRYGAAEIGRWVDANVDQADYMYGLCETHSDFEAVMKPPMSAICIRYVSGELDSGQRARLHHEVARRIEQGGRFWISTTLLKGHTWFRINPVNFRTRRAHMEELLETLARECAVVSASF